MCAIVVAAAQAAAAQDQTLGVGVYPGDPKESAAPVLRVDADSYRNVARLRPAFHSSSWDYNLTAQLVTDGMVDTAPPRWVVVSAGQDGLVSRNIRDLPRELADAPLTGLWRNQSTLPKHRREHVLDGNWVSGVDLRGARGWIQVELHGGSAALAVDAVEAVASVEAPGTGPENWTCTVLGSEDGRTWNDLGKTSGMTNRGGDITPRVTFRSAVAVRYFRIVFDNPRAIGWRVGEVRFFNNGRDLRVGGPHTFSSAWKSEGGGAEWVRVDLGAPCSFDRVVLHWLARPVAGALEVSDDGIVWRKLRELSAGPPAGKEELALGAPVRARHVRVSMARAAGDAGYILSEFEVFGRGGLVAQPQPALPAGADGTLAITRGRWRVQRDNLVQAPGETIAAPGFDDGAWVPATVPGTVLTSYVNAGALPDPNVGDNQLQISDAFFHADFWYRTEFQAPQADGRRRWLHFDGINWNADVYLNGHRVGRIRGAFARTRFDVSPLIKPGQSNVLAVRVEKPANPGSVKEKTFDHPDLNGGVLGADNPSYHASIGWDWIPTIRGRNTGIWNDVRLTSSGPVTVDTPGVSTVLPLPSTATADVTLTTTLVNHTTTAVQGVLAARFGDIAIDVPVSLAGGASQTVTLDPARHAALRIANPRLWWPNGYGAQDLYDVELSFRADGAVSDARRFKAGIRQFTHTLDGNTLRIWINGRRFVPRGGNWGFGESMLRYRGREYDAAMRYHRDLNFTMVRNWVGQIGDDEFWEAADRHGIVIMQDFWLANPWDGPDPSDDALFMANASDLVDAIRTHPSIGLYCGRNEGYPPKPLDDAIRALLAARHGDVPYISSSADDVVSGHGPYRAMPVPYYFMSRATGKIHSEMGMPNIVTRDSLDAMMPAGTQWPLGRMWGLHDFSLDGAQGGRSYLERLQRHFGAIENVRDFVELAQFVNYDGYRAMFEAQSRNRAGLLLWMSHPTWPSLVWQTYDYYFDQSAGYYGARKGAEPLHVQWNPTTESVEVVNYHAGDVTGLTLTARIIDLGGTVRWERTARLDSPEDSTASPIDLEYPLGLSPVHFIRLELRRGDHLVSENTYWRGVDEGNFEAIRRLPKVTLEATTTVREGGDRWRTETVVANTSATPVLMVRIKAVRERSGDRILPAVFGENYVVLMPGERRTFTADLSRADARGERPRIVVDGLNVEGVAYR